MQLILSNGEKFKGENIGFAGSASGEVVFNTAITGYTESLTDPSYNGQILVLTSPMIGNYGVPDQINNCSIHSKEFESEQIHIKGLIILNYSEVYSHHTATRSLKDWLIDNKIPCLAGVDTRQITKMLRENGTMGGKLIYNNDDINWDVTNFNASKVVTCKEVVTYGTGKYKTLLIDHGVKYNIVRKLLNYNTTIIRVPCDYDFSKTECDGIVISNGPGDPRDNTNTIKIINDCFRGKRPILGICLGAQIMALASGAEVYKLKYGHRGHNQPVLDMATNKCYMTAQNHGYAINKNTIPPEWKQYFVNINDSSCEGIKHNTKPFVAVQFHPEASGGPLDTSFIFDKFVEELEKYYKKGA
jgi:carbamoyl-phosphate synthase small subunit